MYRENIYDVIKAVEQSVSILVIPKNTGLKGYAWKVLNEAGLNLEKAQQLDKGTLKLGDLILWLRRGEDIPQIVMDEFGNGRVVLGVTGDDLLDEYRLRNPKNTLRVENTFDWYDDEAKFRRPALSFINRTGQIKDVPIEAVVAINAKYEYNGRLYISKGPLLTGRKYELKIYSGDLEDRVAQDAADCCIDTVYSGTTIGQNGLSVIEVIRFSDLVLISPLKKDGLGLLEKLAAEIIMGQVIDRTVR